MAGDSGTESTVVDLVEAVFEDSDLLEVARAVRAGRADDRLDQYYQVWADRAGRWRPRTTDGWLRPLAFNHWSGYDGGGLAAAWMRLVGDRDGAELLHQQLVRHLLFCDSVAVPDPFVMVAGTTARPRIAGMVADRAAVRAWAADAIEAIHTYRTLLADRIIEVVPAQARPPRLAQAACAAIAEDPELVNRFPAAPAGWSGLSRAQVAAMDIAAQLATAAGALDPYLPLPGHLAVFRKLVRSADALLSKQAADASPHEYSALLPSVLTCPLPEPARLTIADITAIRRDGVFHAWREAVAQGIRQFAQTVGGDPGDWPDPGRGLQRSITEQVRAEAPRQAVA